MLYMDAKAQSHWDEESKMHHPNKLINDKYKRRPVFFQICSNDAFTLSSTMEEIAKCLIGAHGKSVKLDDKLDY